MVMSYSYVGMMNRTSSGSVTYSIIVITSRCRGNMPDRDRQGRSSVILGVLGSLPSQSHEGMATTSAKLQRSNRGQVFSATPLLSSSPFLLQSSLTSGSSGILLIMLRHKTELELGITVSPLRWQAKNERFPGWSRDHRRCHSICRHYWVAPTGATPVRPDSSIHERAGHGPFRRSLADRLLRSRHINLLCSGRPCGFCSTERI